MLHVSGRVVVVSYEICRVHLFGSTNPVISFSLLSSPRPPTELLCIAMFFTCYAAFIAFAGGMAVFA